MWLVRSGSTFVMVEEFLEVLLPPGINERIVLQQLLPDPAWAKDSLGSTKHCPPGVLKLPHSTLDVRLGSGVSHSFGLAGYVIFPGTKDFPFLGDKLFYHRVNLIKPILMFFRFVPKGGFTDIEDGRYEWTSVLSRYSCWRLSSREALSRCWVAVSFRLL